MDCYTETNESIQKNDQQPLLNEVKKNPPFVETIPMEDRTEEMYKYLMQECEDMMLDNVPYRFRTIEITHIAIEKNPRNILSVDPEQFRFDDVLLALNEDFSLMSDLADDHDLLYYNPTKKEGDDTKLRNLCFKKVEENPKMFPYAIGWMNEKMCVTATDAYPKNFAHVPEKYIDKTMCFKMVKRWECALAHVPKKRSTKNYGPDYTATWRYPNGLFSWQLAIVAIRYFPKSYQYLPSKYKRGERGKELAKLADETYFSSRDYCGEEVEKRRKVMPWARTLGLIKRDEYGSYSSYNERYDSDYEEKERRREYKYELSALDYYDSVLHSRSCPLRFQYYR